MKYLIKFRPETSIDNKYMCVEGLNKEDATSTARLHYGLAVDKVFAENELPTTVTTIPFNTVVIYKTEEGKYILYPTNPVTQQDEINLSSISSWFGVLSETSPNKNQKEKICTQIGCHLEEVAEMLTVLGDSKEADMIKALGDEYKTKLHLSKIDNLRPSEHVELLDALSDQIVTATGVAALSGYDINGALKEVNASNWSKFDKVTKVPLYDSNGKVLKGPDYFKPKLFPYVKY